MQVPDIFTTLKQFLPHLTWASAIVGSATFLWALIKGTSHVVSRYGEATEEWKQMSSNIMDCNEQLKLAMTNHLPHIEEATERTAVAVEAIAKALQEQAIKMAVLETQQRYKQ
jgi:hypothetical protein